MSKRRNLAAVCLVAVVHAATWVTASLVTSSGGAAQDERAPAPAPTRVIELFTSQGCPKCPAADKLIAELAREPGTIAVSYPVNLWDFEGWKDTLASSALTQRQRDYAAARGDRRIFTPQAIVDGVDVEAGADRDAILRDTALDTRQDGTLSVPLTLSEEGGQLHLAFGAATEQGPRAAGVYVLRVARQAKVDIRRGQNSGRSVTYTNVVRAISRIGDWTGAAIRFAMPELKADGEGYVVLLQAGAPGHPGTILAAAKTSDL